MSHHGDLLPNFSGAVSADQTRGRTRDLLKDCGSTLLLLLHVFWFFLGGTAQEEDAQFLVVLLPLSTLLPGPFKHDGCLASLVTLLNLGVGMKKGQQTVKKGQFFWAFYSLITETFTYQVSLKCNLQNLAANSHL